MYFEETLKIHALLRFLLFSFDFCGLVSVLVQFGFESNWIGLARRSGNPFDLVWLD